MPTPAKPLSFGLLGVSGYGAFHLKTLSDFEELGLVHLQSVADPAIGRLPQIREVLERRGIIHFADPLEFFRQPKDLDVVSIAAPIPFHEELCRIALKRNSFIYLEKPPVPLLQQWKSLLRLDTAQKIGVAFQNIASAPIQTLKEWCIEGRLGGIETIRIAAGWPRNSAYYGRNDWAGRLVLGGSPVLDGPATNGLAHVLHDALYLASPDPTGFDEPIEVQAELYRARPLESYDTCSLRAKLKGGVEVVAALTHACAELFPYRIEIQGSKARAWIGADGNSLQNDQDWPTVHESTLRYRTRCYEDFIQFAMGHRLRPHTSLADTRGYMLISNAMFVSSGTIHTIGREHAGTVGKGEDLTYAIRGMRDLLENVLRTGKTFAEQGAAWAQEGRVIRADENLRFSSEAFLPS